MNETDLALLDEANACHDDEPGRAADLLRRIEPAALPAERLPGLAFLFNHVLGEKLGAWAEAHTRFEALLAAAGDTPAIALWRQSATAARLAGDDAATARLTAALAGAAGTAERQAQDVVALTAASFQVPALPAAQASEAASAALALLAQPAWDAPDPLDAAVAACTNNIASHLVERAPAELQVPALRSAVVAAAQAAERFWLRAGNWVHHERAAYLRAMVANALGDAAQARDHALRALALIDANDTAREEQVDRAFIELEHARACRDLALDDEARTAQDTADALAAQFNDPGLDEWFAGRRLKLAGTAPR